MKHITRYILTAAVVIAMAGICSCVEKPSPEAGETATVRLGIGISGNGIDVEEGPWTKAYVEASQYEGLRTVRVIVTSGDADSREILHNGKITIDDTAPFDAASAVYEITGLPVGIPLNFYVIGNEESLGMEYTDEVINDRLDQNHKILFIDEAADIDSRLFPKTGPQIVTNGLPMTGMTTETLSEGHQDIIYVDLYRSVLKISLTVENRTNTSIALNYIKFGPFFGDRFYLFRERELDVPSNTEYESKVYKVENIATVEPSTTCDPLSLYLYPAYSNTSSTSFDVYNSPFTLEMATSVRKYNPLVFATNTNSFVRNTQVNIHASITTTGANVAFTVSDWDSYTFDIQPFE